MEDNEQRVSRIMFKIQDAGTPSKTGCFHYEFVIKQHKDKAVLIKLVEIFGRQVVRFWRSEERSVRALRAASKMMCQQIPLFPWRAFLQESQPFLQKYFSSLCCNLVGFFYLSENLPAISPLLYLVPQNFIPYNTVLMPHLSFVGMKQDY